MTFCQHIGIAAAMAVVLAAQPAEAEVSPAERAAEVLREAAAGKDEGARLFVLEKATTVRVPGLEASARQAASSADRVARTLGLELLAAIDAAGNREVFLEALGSPYRSVRLRALRALLTLSDAGLATRFVEVLEKDPDPDLRALAARGLRPPCTPEAQAALRRAVATGHPVVQTAAVRALVANGDFEVGLELLERARGAFGAERRRLFDLVGLVPDPDLVPLLGKLLEDPDRELRAEAAAAILSSLGPSR
jgi:HEAT repeat protein